MFLAALVVEQRFTRRALFYRLAGNDDGAVRLLISVEDRHFERRERRARVAVREGRYEAQNVGVDPHVHVAEPFRRTERALEKFDDFIL